ncbi:hypothetical protein BDEG_27856 [Batrachochytrium dendrobatidis JEL423]|uniref:Uncharacterized protein n=1 Tax=Batrachochytrium dendrobatidis (strain JEL423) TaxID=403673 RepID=A0A177WXJ6_BATDL|nr:hypothetical protein BDEG_27856 [Batrachochytrium dendrobatidis JEL423]
MKLAVTVLSSILFACSVTTANPVNPSATTSTDASTSTTQPTATESNKSGLWTASNEEIATWVDVSQFTKADAELIKQYLKLTQEREKAKEMRNLLKQEIPKQEKLVKQLDQESWWLFREFGKGKGPKYGKKLNEAREKYRKEEIKRIKLEKEYYKINPKDIDLGLKLDFVEKELAKRLFGDDLNSPLFYSHTNSQNLSKPPLVEPRVYHGIIKVYQAKRLQTNPLKSHPIQRELSKFVLVHGKLIPK